LFDWDDTLCPSNWIRENRPALSFFKPAPNDEKYQRPLREIQKNVKLVLDLAMKLGKVIIVTNAQHPWVETSAKHFLPQLLPYLQQIPVLYARSIYETHHVESLKKNGKRSSSPGNAMPGMYSSTGQNRLVQCNTQLMLQQDEMLPRKWKEIAFEQEISGFYSRYAHQSWKNVISIGDSIFERDAVRRVILSRKDVKGCKKCRTKTVKLLDDPDCNELVAQVRLLFDVLGMMVQHDGNLDIEVDEEDLGSLADQIMEG
jgi:hypothetical protein